MPAKRVYLKHVRDKQTWIKSVLLPNGNLVIPRIISRKPYVSRWVEVEPGTADYKRWYTVHVVETDPRELQGYKDQVAAQESPDEY